GRGPHGVIDGSTNCSSVLGQVWPGEVFVITYRDDRAKALADLDRYGIRHTGPVLANSFSEKAEGITRLGIGVYVDDQDEVLMHNPKKVTVLKLRNGGNYDYAARKGLDNAGTSRAG